MKFSSETKSLLIILTIFILLSLLLFWPIFFGKVNLNGHLLTTFYPIFSENLPFKNTGIDQLRIYFPFYKVTFEAFRNFTLPFWNPYAFSGHPHLADFQTAVFYPLNIFGLFMGQIEFWHLLRVTPTILAAFFMYLYLNNLRLSKLASFFGAMTFGFSPFILTWGEEQIITPHTIVWAPLILFSIDRFVETTKKFFLGVISMSIAFSIFSGFPQTTLYLVILTFVYSLMRIWSRKKIRLNLLAKMVSAYILGVFVSSMQLLPSVELYLNSVRSSLPITETLEKFLIPGYSLITLLTPDFFGNPSTRNFFRGGSAQYYEGIIFVGIAVLIFSIYSAFSFRRNSFLMFWGILFFIPLLIVIDWPIAKMIMRMPLPIINGSIPNRIIFVLPLATAVLSSYGLDKWLRSSNKNIRWPILITVFLYVSVFLYLFFVKFFHLKYFNETEYFVGQPIRVSLRNLLVSGSVVFFCVISIIYGTYFSKYKKWVAISLVVISYLHIFYFSQKYFSFSDRKYILPNLEVLEFIQKNQGYFRSLGVGEGYLENNFASFYKLYSPEGYASLNDRSYAEFAFAMSGEKIEDFIFRADANLGFGSPEKLLSSRDIKKLIDIVGVKYLIAAKKDFELLENNDYKMLFASSDDNFAVYENLNVLPRAFLASNYEGPPHVDSTNKTDEQIKKERRKLIPQKLMEDNFDWRNVLILEEPSPISPQFGEGTAEILSYKPQEVIIKTNSKEPKLLFLSDNYYPGWKAQVDGSKVEILRANYTFRVVPLIGGEHLVRFYWDSEVMKAGILISTFSFLVLAFLILRKNPILG